MAGPNSGDKYTHVSNLSVGNDANGGNLKFPLNSQTSGIKVGTDANNGYPWHDITSEVKARGVGATDPAWEQINSTVFYAYNFAVNDQVWHSFHIPHDYVQGTDVYIHSHWMPDGTNTATVRWEYTYAYAHGHNQAAYNLTGTTVTADQTVGGTQYQHYVTESAALSIDMEPDGILEVRVRRVTNGAVDNTDGIFLLTSDVHYQSTDIGTASRAPDFYAL